MTRGVSNSRSANGGLSTVVLVLPPAADASSLLERLDRFRVSFQARSEPRIVVEDVGPIRTTALLNAVSRWLEEAGADPVRVELGRRVYMLEPHRS